MNKKVVVLFVCRAILWCVALAATIYWIYWNFKLYSMGVFDVHEFASIFRFKFYKALIVSIAAICLSFILRRFSDGIKRMEELDKFQKALEDAQNS